MVSDADNAVKINKPREIKCMCTKPRAKLDDIYSIFEIIPGSNFFWSSFEWKIYYKTPILKAQLFLSVFSERLHCIKMTFEFSVCI